MWIKNMLITIEACFFRFFVDIMTYFLLEKISQTSNLDSDYVART